MPDNRGHSIVSPSGAHSWSRCTKGPRFTQWLDLPDESTDYAAEGTIAHWLCEQWLRTGDAPDFTVRMDCPYDDAVPEVVGSGGHETFTMKPYVQEYVDYVQAQIPRDGSRYELGVEEAVDLGRWVPGMRGSADSVVRACWGPEGPEMLYVNDFKYGVGVKVPADYGTADDPEPNPQLSLYALGLLTPSVRTVRISIIQPRLSNTVWLDMTRAMLLETVAPLVRTANMAYQGVGRFDPSPETCRFCQARPYCRAAALAAGLDGCFDAADAAGRG